LWWIMPYMSKLLTTKKSKSEKLYISLYIYWPNWGNSQSSLSLQHL
jgi:hypothetical protein